MLNNHFSSYHNKTSYPYPAHLSSSQNSLPALLDQLSSLLRGQCLYLTTLSLPSISPPPHLLPSFYASFSEAVLKRVGK